MDARLHSQPLWPTAFVLVGLAVAVTYVLSLLVHRRYTTEALKGNNEVAGFKFGVIGAVYGLLLALALVAVWENFARARENAAQEEACVVGIGRIAWGLADGGETVATALTHYKLAADREWGHVAADEGAVRAVDEIGHALAAERDAASAPYVAAGLERLDRLAELRAARREGSRNGMPEFLWSILVVGAVVTVGFSFFFGSPNRRSQRAMAALLAGTLTLVLFAVVELDHAYDGEVRVESPFSE